MVAEVSEGRDGVKVKLADRMKALQWLSDHMDLATEEQRVRVEKMRAETDHMKNSSAGNGAGEVDDWIAAVMNGIQNEKEQDA